MKPKKPKRKTVWQKIDYLMECIDDFDMDHIRYCEFPAAHILINYKKKWAYLVHDPGTVVSEIAFEKIDYERTVARCGKHLKDLQLENL